MQPVPAIRRAGDLRGVRAVVSVRGPGGGAGDDVLALLVGSSGSVAAGDVREVRATGGMFQDGKRVAVCGLRDVG